MRRHWKRITAGLVGIVLLGALALFFTGNREVVDAYAMEEEPYRQTVRATGRVASSRVLDVRTEVTGMLETLDVEEGDLVSEGALLAVVDDGDLQIRLSQARAQLRSAQARLQSLGETQAPISRESLEQLSLRRESQLREVQRQESLYEEGAVPLTSLERARQELDILESQLAAARTTLQAQSSGGSQTREAAAGVEQARSQVLALENELNKHRIYAPVSGRITRTFLGAGEWTQTGAGLLTLVSEDAFFVEVDLDERLIGLIKPGQPADVWPDAFPSQTVAGVVDRIGREVDTATGTVTVRIAISEGSVDLIRDLTVQVEIEVRRLSDALLIPARFLAAQSPQRVLVLENGQVRERTVTGEVVDVSRILVLDGLSAGERLLDPQAGLTPGQDLDETRVKDVDVP